MVRKSCYNCFNLKQAGKGLIGCRIKRFEKIYYPRWRYTLAVDFKRYAYNCKHFKKVDK